MITIWNRIESDENEQLTHKWEHKNTGDTVKVEKYVNNTWDTKHNERLIENFDTQKEAIQRSKKLVGES